MASTSQLAFGAPSRPSSEGLTPPLIAVAVWQIAVALGLGWAAMQVWNLPPDALPAISNLGDFAQRAIAVFMVGLALSTLAGGLLMLRLNNGGRLLAMLLSFGYFVLALLVFGSLLGLYLGIDALVFPYTTLFRSRKSVV